MEIGQIRSLFASFLVLLSGGHSFGQTTQVYDIPQLAHIAIDGQYDDWSQRGFRVNALAGAGGRVGDPTDIHARFRLGWDPRGLLVLVLVTDDEIKESHLETWLVAGDGVQFFLANPQSGYQAGRFDVAPGLDPEYPQLRSYIFAYNGSGPLTIEAQSRKTSNGYVLEARLPWSHTGISPQVGYEIDFQVQVVDRDVNSGGSQIQWYPLAMDYQYMDPARLHRLRLSGKASRSANVAASAAYDETFKLQVGIVASADLGGEVVRVLDGQHQLGAGPLIQEGAQAALSLVIPRPERGAAYGDLSVVLGKTPVYSIPLEGTDLLRASYFIEAPLRPSSWVFHSTDFPICEFEQPFWVEYLIGPYNIDVSYYDQDYNRVTSAQTPGRYGAVADIRTADGRRATRFLTLFRAPAGVYRHTYPAQYAWFDSENTRISLNPHLGMEDAVSAAYSDIFKGFLEGALWEYAGRSKDIATLLGGLAPGRPSRTPASVFDDPAALERQWWVGLKRRLNGNDKRFSAPFIHPRPLTGSPAPVLRSGTAQEAGFQADAVDEIDALLQEWAANSRPAFSVCIARHGVVLLHRAYGQRGPEPMTTATQSSLASLTKLFQAILVMMAVDQQLIDLDAPIDRYLPALTGIQVEKPATLHHLLSHSAGMWGHWGDLEHDFEHKVAQLYPYLKIGTTHEYNGASLALGSKILEQVTGEALPQLYKKHLLDPLGCTNTEISNSSWNARSTAMDLARIGQLLLNRGAYGDKRYFSETTYAKMLPQRLTKLLDPRTTMEWGIGLIWWNKWFPSDGLSPHAVTHGAGSSTRLIVDPEHDLVLSMTRNSDGANFLKYAGQFNRLVTSKLVEDSAKIRRQRK